MGTVEILGVEDGEAKGGLIGDGQHRPKQIVAADDGGIHWAGAGRD